MASSERAAIVGAAMELERIRVQIENMVGLQQTDRGRPLQGARNVPLTRLPIIYAGDGRLVGWSVRNAGTTDTTLRLWTSRDGTGDLVAALDLAAGESHTSWMGPGGVSFVDGLSGTTSEDGVVEGSAWLGAVD